MTVTNDLTKFGYRELDMAGDLLKAYAQGGCEFLTDNVNVFMNDMSGYVFLSDEDYNVGILEDGKLVQFFTCSQCGNEGTQSDYDFEKYDGYCSEECKEKS